MADSIISDSGTQINIYGNLVVDTPTLVIDATNNRVGIGESTPLTPLHVVRSGSYNPPALTLENPLTSGYDSGIQFRNSYTVGDHALAEITSETDAANYAGCLYFRTSDTGGTMNTRMILTNAGCVGIGTTSVDYLLEVNSLTAGKLGGGSWSDSSDVRLKKNIKPITGALDKITKLQGMSFKWINPDEHGNLVDTQGGFIAQDIEKVFPKWVSEINPSGKDLSLVPKCAKIKSFFLPFEFDAYIVEAIKEQQQQIETLTAENEKQQQQIADLIKRLTLNTIST